MRFFLALCTPLHFILCAFCLLMAFSAHVLAQRRPLYSTHASALFTYQVFGTLLSFIICKYACKSWHRHQDFTICCLFPFKVLAGSYANRMAITTMCPGGPHYHTHVFFPQGFDSVLWQRVQSGDAQANTNTMAWVCSQCDAQSQYLCLFAQRVFDTFFHTSQILKFWPYHKKVSIRCQGHCAFRRITDTTMFYELSALSVLRHGGECNTRPYRARIKLMGLVCILNLSWRSL